MTSEPYPLPMFPLGSVLFPHMVLPLHVFEPRYRVMVRRILDGDGRFGVTLIERGHEVGGGDVRMDVGTVAEVLRAEELDDGRWLLVAVGRSRLAVRRWLPDDPYPQAEVVDLPDVAPGPDAVTTAMDAAVRLRRVLALQEELGEATVPSDVDVAADPLVASYQVAVLAPLNPIDAQAALALDRPEDRISLVARELADIEDVLRFRIDAHEEPDDGGR